VPAEPHLPVGRVKVQDEAGTLIAIGQVTSEGQLAPKRVFIR
jgi:hypothetical protein